MHDGVARHHPPAELEDDVRVVPPQDACELGQRAVVDRAGEAHGQVPVDRADGRVGTPMSRASLRIVGLSGDCAMCSRDAARPKCSSSATATNASSHLISTGPFKHPGLLRWALHRPFCAGAAGPTL